MLLTLFLVQHHRPEERGVLPRAIRPRLQQAARLGLLTAAAPGNGFETRGWLDYASINQKPWKDELPSARFSLSLLSINNNSNTEYALGTRGDPHYPDRSAVQIK